MAIPNHKLREIYRNKRELGICVNYNCSIPAEPGRCRCASHAKYQRDTNTLNRHRWKQPTNEERKDYWQKIKKEVMDAYGAYCACCGVTGLPFLTIDHINGNGNKHRLETFGSSYGVTRSFYLWLRRNNYPPEFQVLCWNCNLAKRNGPVCPHELGIGERVLTKKQNRKYEARKRA